MANKFAPMTKVRCQEGWRLFFVIGDEYTRVVNISPQPRDWERHEKAVKQHKEHIEQCSMCRSGLKEIQLTLEEMAVENGSRIS